MNGNEVTRAQIIHVAELASRAAAALIPLAGGGKDTHGNVVVDSQAAIQRARQALQGALDALGVESDRERLGVTRNGRVTEI